MDHDWLVRIASDVSTAVAVLEDRFRDENDRRDDTIEDLRASSHASELMIEKLMAQLTKMTDECSAHKKLIGELQRENTSLKAQLVQAAIDEEARVVRKNRLMDAMLKIERD